MRRQAEAFWLREPGAGELRPVHIGRSCRLARAELERYVRMLQNHP